MKKCNHCKLDKKRDEFNKHPEKKDGLKSYCKTCQSSYSKKEYLKNKKTILERMSNYYKEKVKAKRLKNKIPKKKITLEERRKKKNDLQKVKYHENKEYNSFRSKMYYKKNKESVIKRTTKYSTHRAKNDLLYRLRIYLRNRVRQALKGDFKSGSAVKDLGCTIEELKQHLESKFQDGMSWENHGICGWHIDHIRPLASFNLTDRNQLLQACHYTNLQPLWAIDNIRKGNKV